MADIESAITAGVQHALFQEASCECCEKFFLGGWMYDKPVAFYGNDSKCEWVGTPESED